jgi:hypothetical protein
VGATFFYKVYKLTWEFCSEGFIANSKSTDSTDVDAAGENAEPSVVCEIDLV